MFWNAVAGIQMIPTYINAIIRVPIQYDNMHKVTHLNLGTDKNGNPEVGLRLYGTVNSGTVSNSLTYKGQKGNTKSTVTFNWADTIYRQQETTQQDYTLQKTQEYSRHNGGSGSLSGTASIELTLNSIDNLATQTTVYEENGYKIIDFTILCGLKITKLGSTFKWQQYGSDPDTITASMDGTYEEYIPSLCEVTVYGNTIGIKLVEETHRIGDPTKGETIYYSANELIQTTNTYGNNYSTSTQNLMAKSAVQPRFQPTAKCAEFDTFDIPVYNGYVNLPELQKYQYVGNNNCAHKLAKNSLVSIYFIPTYVNTTVSIPIHRENNEDVSHIIIGGGIDEDYGVCGTPIKVHRYGTVNKGKATNTLTYDGKTKNGNVSLETIVCEQLETNEQDYELQTKQSYSCNNAYLEYELNSLDNVDTTTAIRQVNDDYIEVDLTILIGLKVIKLGGIFDTDTTENITADMNGEYEEYICKACELTIYGATKHIEV